MALVGSLSSYLSPTVQSINFWHALLHGAASCSLLSREMDPVGSVPTFEVQPITFRSKPDQERNRWGSVSVSKGRGIGGYINRSGKLCNSSFYITDYSWVDVSSIYKVLKNLVRISKCHSLPPKVQEWRGGDKGEGDEVLLDDRGLRVIG